MDVGRFEPPIRPWRVPLGASETLSTNGWPPMLVSKHLGVLARSRAQDVASKLAGRHARVVEEPP